MNFNPGPGRLLASLDLSLALLAGCAAQQVADYPAEKPALDMRQYFNGTVDAYGVFTVVMKCSWSGPPGAETGLLDEDFSYSDGSKDRRVWTLKRTPEGRYTGTAAEVVGEAAGEEKGNAFRWGYTLKLPVESRVIDVQFDDWMYLMSDKILLNKATMSKFGMASRSHAVVCEAISHAGTSTTYVENQPLTQSVRT